MDAELLVGSSPAKSFRYMYPLGKGDLAIYIMDSYNLPVAPYEVLYTLFQGIFPGMQRSHPKTPVKGVVGEYYIVGGAGELGQPGDWFVRWRVQRFFQGPVQVCFQPFKVLEGAV